jgi:hypothetical protein
MIENGKTCESWESMCDNRCNSPAEVNDIRDEWIAGKFCQQSCFDCGNGYDGDNCA